MNQLKHKLNSQNGASIILALFLFLICGFVAAVTLGSAATNARKYDRQRKEQQLYLSISSAAQMFRDALSGNVLEGTEEEWIYLCKGKEVLVGYTPEDSNYLSRPVFETDRFSHSDHLEIKTGDDRLTALIAEGAFEVWKSQLKYNGKVAFPGWQKKLTIEADSMDTVQAILSMDDNYNITVYLNGIRDDIELKEYAMTVTFKADFLQKEEKDFLTSCTHTITEKKELEDGTISYENVDISTDIQHDLCTTTITIKDGEIRKGGADL